MYNNVILIPALDPDESFVRYVGQLREAGCCRIVVVDDGSSTEKKHIFDTLGEQYGCDIITHAQNLGKGRSLKDGFLHIEKKYADYDDYKGVITADSDGQHTVSDVIKLSERLDSATDPTLFLGCRDFDLDIVPQKSKKGNKITSGVFKLLYGSYLSDTQTGLRAISRELALEYAHLKGERFEFETNMLIHATREHHSIIEVPIETVYIDNNSESHFRPVVDSVKIYKLLLAGVFKFTLSSILSTLIDQGLANVFFYLVFGGTFAFAAKAIARVVSATFNFLVNRNMVFKVKKKGDKQWLRYAVLVVCQLLVSSTAVWAITKMFSEIDWAFTVVSIAVDAVLFFASYTVQRKWVFRN